MQSLETLWIFSGVQRRVYQVEKKHLQLFSLKVLKTCLLTSKQSYANYTFAFVSSVLLATLLIPPTIVPEKKNNFPGSTSARRWPDYLKTLPLIRKQYLQITVRVSAAFSFLITCLFEHRWHRPDQTIAHHFHFCWKKENSTKRILLYDYERREHPV